MKKRTPVIALTVLVVTLVIASAAWAATQGRAVGPAKAGTTSRGGAGRCGVLATNPAAWKDMQALRAQHLSGMKAWYDKYGQDPSNPEAQAALATLRSEHWNDMLALMKQYGVSAPTGAGPGMMGDGGPGNGWHMMSGTGSRPGAGMMGGSGMMGGN